jgi:UPF0716 protein FxsA
MAGLLVLMLFVLPFVELAVFIAVAGEVGLLATVAVIIVVGVAGGLLVRHQGLGVWRRAQRKLRDGEMPSAEVVNGLLILTAGVLLALPGFLSDVLGIALLLPPVRAAVRSLLLARFERRMHATLAGPVAVAFGGRPSGLRVRTGSATYDVREADDVPGPPGRPGLERP